MTVSTPPGREIPDEQVATFLRVLAHAIEEGDIKFPQVDYTIEHTEPRSGGVEQMLVDFGVEYAVCDEMVIPSKHIGPEL